MADTKTLNSTVTRTSQYGFQLQETGDAWINYGKFYEGSKDISVGEKILLEATESNGKLYVNSIEGKSSGKADNDAVQSLVNDANKLEVERDSRQILIVRQSALKAAVELNKAGDRNGDKVTANDVLVDASIFEEWVMR